MAIIGCEIGGDFINFEQMNVFVGYWTAPIFTMAWISLAGASCCCRIRCCGIATLVFQCFSIPMAFCIIGFDSYFLDNPTLCFFSTCKFYRNSYSGSYYGYTYYNTSDLYNIKMPLIRGQLAAGVLMFISNVIYIIIFGVVAYRARNGVGLQNGYPAAGGVVYPPGQPQYPSPYVVNTQSRNHHQRPAPPPPSTVDYRNQIVCPHCGSGIQVFTARY